MPRPSTFTPEIAATIIGARRVGAPLRQCAKAAAVPWRTLCDWLRAGRDGDERFAAFTAEVDKADADLERVLRARALKGTEDDPRLAFDMLRWRESQEERKAKLRLLRAQGTVEEKRATGEHVERHEHSMKDPLDELRSRLDRLALTGEAGGDPRLSDG